MPTPFLRGPRRYGDDPQDTCAIADLVYTLSWKAPRMEAVEIRVYGVTTCFEFGLHAIALCMACYGCVSLRSVAMLRVVDPLLERTVRSALPVREVWEVPVTAGTIKKVVADRGFGFIVAEDAKEYFFHRGGLDSSIDFDRLVGGERVEFEIETSPKGPRATQVRSA